MPFSMPFSMIRRSVLLFLSAICLSAAAVAARADLPAVIERVAPSVVGIGTAFPPRVPTGGKPTRRLLGSGFAVNTGDRHYVVTNAHVIPDDLDTVNLEQLVVFTGRGTLASQRVATVVARDEEHDLALLRYQGTPLPALSLAADTMIRAGEVVAFTGFPIGAVLGLYPATHSGIVAAITPAARVADRGAQLTPQQMRRLRRPYDVYQLDAIAYPGNSGSAVYSAETGEVIGVVNSVFIKETRENLLARPSGITFAIPVRHLRALLAAQAQ
jgi:serine protease Do